MDVENANIILKQLSNALVLVEKDFSIHYLNQHATQQIASSDKSLIGNKCHQYFYNSDKACDICPIKDAQKTAFTAPSHYNCMGGRFEINSQQITLDSGFYTLLQLSIPRRGELMLNQLFNLSADMICIASTTGNMIQVNPAWTEILGFTVEELLKIPFFDLIHPDDLVKTYEVIADKLEQNELVYNFENRYKCKDGNYKWLSWVSQPFGDEDLLFAIARDVSNQKKIMEELIEAKDKAEESDKLKMAFLANMSHEIRTPMNAIMGFSSLLDREELSVEKRKHYVSVIQKRSEDLLSIINDILDISKIESGQLQLIKEEFMINDLLTELLEDYRQKLSAIPQVSLDFYIGKRADESFNRLQNDRLRIKQVFANLLDNAIKFTDRGQISYGCVSRFDNLQFYVSDTGIGIPKEKQYSVFERFRQADESMNRQRGGNGLGLSISKALVEMMGGSIRFESAEGAGTTFYFTIPWEKSNNGIFTEGLKKIGEGINLVGKKILIVEDDPMSRQFLKYILQNVGATLIFAQTGIEALEIYSESAPFDLVLMDIQLPDISGFEVTSKIRETDEEIPIIAQTAFPMTNDQVESKLAGCTGYLQKPIKSDDLLAVIVKSINKSKAG